MGDHQRPGVARVRGGKSQMMRDGGEPTFHGAARWQTEQRADSRRSPATDDWPSPSVPQSTSPSVHQSLSPVAAKPGGRSSHHNQLIPGVPALHAPVTVVRLMARREWITRAGRVPT